MSPTAARAERWRTADPQCANRLNGRKLWAVLCCRRLRVQYDARVRDRTAGSLSACTGKAQVALALYKLYVPLGEAGYKYPPWWSYWSGKTVPPSDALAGGV